MSTSAPTLVKLTKAGETLTMAVKSCELMKIGSYPEVEFIGFDGKKDLVAVRVPQKSADRQLARCDITHLQQAIGKLMTIGRDPNAQDPKKPYWSVTLEGEAPAEYTELLKAPLPAAAAQSAPTPAAAQQPAATPPTNGVAEREKYSTAYKRVTEYVLSDIVPLYEAKKIPLTADTCHAMAATLFIAVTRNGH